MINTFKTPRLRVFAGPNGSGKSTIIKFVGGYQPDGLKIDLGVYINADDIAVELKENRFRFDSYKIQTTLNEFRTIAIRSGLIGSRFTETSFAASFRFHSNRIFLKDINSIDAIAQIIADFLRKKLLQEKKKFSFETVFSHPSKLAVMKEAKEAGYRVYLYFVCTKKPELNIERVKFRVNKKGHDVPKERIISRYNRSLDLLYPAAQLADRAFFFDNSGTQPILFGSFRLENEKKKWDKMKAKDIPDWFYKYYSLKTKKR